MLGEQVYILNETFRSKSKGFDGVVVKPKFEVPEDTFFVLVYFTGDIVPFKRSEIRTQKEVDENQMEMKSQEIKNKSTILGMKYRNLMDDGFSGEQAFELIMQGFV